jgi:hypothetical protein
MARTTLAPILSDELISEQLRLAERELCVDDPELCLGFPETVEDAIARLNPSGYCFIGWVWSRPHHWSFGVWFNVDSGRRAFAKPWWQA